MTLAIAGSSAASVFSTGGAANWMSDAMTAIQNQQNQGGLLGMLQNSGGDGSISSFLSASSNLAGNLATISQSNVTSAGSLFAQMAASNQQKQQAQKLQQSLDQLSAQKQIVQPKNVLDPIIYFPNGSTIDTTSNIMTMPDGTQYDITTGLKYVDPSSTMQIAGGATLNTSTNILTLADGTQIDTVTGLKVSATA